MRVLRVSTNPERPDERVPDYAALDSGVMRWMKPGKTYEVSSDKCQPAVLDTVTKALRSGTLVPVDAATAKHAGVPMKAPAKSDAKPSKAEG